MPKLIASPSGLNRRLAEFFGVGDAIEAEEAAYKRAQEKLKRQHQKRLDKLTARRRTLFEAIAAYALANWLKLTDAAAPRTAILREGVISRTKKTVKFGKLNAQATRDIVEELRRRRGGMAYIRIKEEVDVERLKKDESMLRRLAPVLAKHGIDAAPTGETVTIKRHDVQVLASRADRPS